MRVIVAPDSFKENMDAATAARHIVAGIRRVDPSVECVEVPIADGGEGLVDVLLAPLEAELVDVAVTGPMGTLVRAPYGWSARTHTAVIEVASACGIHLVPRGVRDIWRASTFGVGELLADARARGARRLIIGLGGSVTNDGGAGALAALGARLVSDEGDPRGRVPPVSAESSAATPAGGPVGSPGFLRRVGSVDVSGMEAWPDIEVILACDVTNPMCGPDGASAVFGPQKGASPEDVPLLDDVLRHWTGLLERATGRPLMDVPGAGAAGGLGGALLAGLGADVRSGIEVVLDLTGFRDLVATADLTITGEGRMDAQTLSGKAPWGVQQASAAAGVPTIAFCGIKGPGAEALDRPGRFAAVVEICDPATPLDEALANGPRNIADTAERVFRRICAGGLPALHEVISR